MSFREISVFDGGINNLIASHLIQENQATYVLNANINSGAIVSQKEKKVTNKAVSGKYGYYYRSKNEVITSDEDIFYVEWGGFLYWSNSNGTMKRYDGITINDIGSHTPPNAAPTVVIDGDGLLDGDYWYAFTYVHDFYFESPPSDFAYISVTKNKVNITLTGTHPASATSIKIYRSGGLNPTFNLLATLPIDVTTYTDNIDDFLISREELTTYNNGNPPYGLDMLTETSGIFFGALGNKVYFSQQGQPEYWSPYSYVQVPENVTGLGAIGNGVVIFTISSMYFLTGNNLTNISLTKLPFSYGCKNKRSIQNVGGNLVWVAEMENNDYICIYNGNNVQIANMYATGFNQSTIGELSYDEFLGAYNEDNFEIKNSLSAFNKYFLFMKNRTAVVDFLNGAKVYYSSDNIDSGYTIGNNIYVIEDGLEYDYTPDFSNYRNIIYKTKDFVDGLITQSKSYRMVKISAIGTYEITVLVNDFTVAKTTSEKFFLPSGTVGNKISFIIKSYGYANINAISYEYELLSE